MTILLTAVLISCSTNTEKKENFHPISWAYQLQGADPEEIETSGFKLIVMDYSRDGSENSIYSKDEINSIKSHGVIPVAYISIGEAEDYRFYWKEEWQKNPPDWLGPENPEWKGNYAVKYWDSQWQKIIFTYIDKILQQGFSGIYLDKVDEFEFWVAKGYKEEFTAEKMIDFIISISKYTRNRKGKNFLIIPQNGEGILKFDDGRLLNEIDGWAAEDLFFNGTRRWSDEEQKWINENRITMLQKIIKNDKFVLCVDYVDDGSGYYGDNLERIKNFISMALQHKFSPYAARSDRELNLLNIIPGIQPGNF